MTELIYLASPYSHDCKMFEMMRYHSAMRACVAMMNRGLHVFSPIVHSHPMAIKHDLPKDFAFWVAYNRRWIDACDSLAVLAIDGWRESKGVNGEAEYALSLGKRVWYVDEDGQGI